MEKNKELQKKAQSGEIAIKGTLTPDITTEPVAPIEKTERRPFSDPDGETIDQRIARNQPDED